MLVRQHNYNKYCSEHNLSYRTFNDHLKLYKQSNNNENWSPNSKRRHNHPMFTDSTDKQTTEQLIEQYINQQKPCNNNDLSE